MRRSPTMEMRLDPGEQQHESDVLDDPFEFDVDRFVSMNATERPPPGPQPPTTPPPSRDLTRSP